MKLFHGTSSSIAKSILRENCIRPAATDPISAHGHGRGDVVYLTEAFHLAVMFGYGRSVGGRMIASGEFRLPAFVPGQSYDKIVVFTVESDKSLIDGIERYSEKLYQGIVPATALTEMHEIVITERVVDFVTACFEPKILKRYVGKDLRAYLGIKSFGLECESDSQ
jgi:hypothetical protein